MSARKLADYAEYHAPRDQTTRMRDFRKWVAAHKAEIERRVLFGRERRVRKTGWITPKVTDEAWRLLKKQRAENDRRED
jgi:hypothetical protein